MKKFISLVISALFSVTLLCQNPGQMLDAENQAKADELNRSLQNGEYLKAIDEISVLLSNPLFKNYLLFFKRGLARAGLNDIPGARKDFILAQSSGFMWEGEFIAYMTSKKFLVKSLIKDLKLDVKLDSTRDFRPVILPKDTIQGALRPERTCFDVTYYNLILKILPDSKSIEGSNRIYFKTTTDTKVIQIDLFPEFTVSAVRWKDKSLNFDRKEGGIYIDFGRILPAGSNEEIIIDYSGVPVIAKKPPWNGGFVWEKDKNKHHIGVACEGLGASSWWPVKDHLSDKPDSMVINLQVPKGYQGIANGNLRSKKDIPGDYTNFEWFISYPINNYNVTCYMGDYVNFSEQYSNGGTSYPIDYYVLPKNLEKAKKYYAQTKDIVAVYEKLFGEYPFIKDGIGMVEAPFEGMEHQGAIAIGGGYGKGNNRRDYWTKDYDYLLIHETAHEWWGNAVAIGDMADAWINEGFTTYSECLFAEEKSGYGEYLEALADQQSYILDIWPIVGERNINTNSFLGGDIYNKGSAMLNNLRCIINNDTLFRGMIKAFYQKNKYRIVTTEDFVNHVKGYTKTDFSDFFDKFLYDDEPPVLACNYNIDRTGTLYFTYQWKNVGNNFTMPFCVAVSNKEYIRLNGTTFQQTFRYDNAKTFFLPNENRFDKELVPANSFTYYWTSWPF